MAALQRRGHENMLVCPPGSGVDTAARRAGLKVHNLFCAGDLDLPFAYRLSQFIREQSPDIVHCHSRRGADVLGGLAASFADVPAIVSRRVDNTEVHVMAALRYKPFRRIVAISDAIAEVLRSHGIDDDRIVVIRDAVDSEAFSALPDRDVLRREFGIEADDFAIAAAGQLIERKGYGHLLQALACLRPEHPRMRLVLFGEGEFYHDLQELAGSLELTDTLHFAGFRDDLDDLLGAFDLFVHPALAEGLGVVTLKAAAAGLAVVACAAGGVPEAVAHGESGLLVAPGDPSALAAAIAELQSDGKKRRKMAIFGRRRMQSEFSIATMGDRHIALYESVIDGGPRSDS